LFFYLGTTNLAVNAILVQDEGVLKLVYYANKVLYGTKTRYMKIENIAFALISAVKKLKPYF